MQLPLNLPCFGLDIANCYKKERVSLHRVANCFNQSDILIELGHLLRYGAIALNKLTNVRIIAPKCYLSCDQNDDIDRNV